MQDNVSDNDAEKACTGTVVDGWNCFVHGSYNCELLAMRRRASAHRSDPPRIAIRRTRLVGTRGANASRGAELTGHRRSPRFVEGPNADGCGRQTDLHGDSDGHNQTRRSSWSICRAQCEVRRDQLAGNRIRNGAHIAGLDLPVFSGK